MKILAIVLTAVSLNFAVKIQAFELNDNKQEVKKEELAGKLDKKTFEIIKKMVEEDQIGVGLYPNPASIDPRYTVLLDKINHGEGINEEEGKELDFLLEESYRIWAETYGLVMSGEKFREKLSIYYGIREREKEKKVKKLLARNFDYLVTSGTAEEGDDGDEENNDGVETITITGRDLSSFPIRNAINFAVGRAFAQRDLPDGAIRTFRIPAFRGQPAFTQQFVFRRISTFGDALEGTRQDNPIDGDCGSSICILQ